MPPYFNSYTCRSYLEKIVTPYTLRPHPLPVPRVSDVFAEARLIYKLVVTKNKFAASDEVISCRINDQSYSLIGFNQYVIKKMVDSYSYVCIKSLSHLWPCIVYCCIWANRRCANDGYELGDPHVEPVPPLHCPIFANCFQFLLSTFFLH